MKDYGSPFRKVKNIRELRQLPRIKGRHRQPEKPRASQERNSSRELAQFADCAVCVLAAPLRIFLTPSFCLSVSLSSVKFRLCPPTSHQRGLAKISGF